MPQSAPEGLTWLDQQERINGYALYDNTPLRFRAPVVNWALIA